MMSDFSDPNHAKHDLIQNMVFTAVEVGFAVVQEVAAATLVLTAYQCWAIISL